METSMTLRTRAKTLLSAATLMFSVCSVAVLATQALAQDLPPGVTIAVNDAFAPSHELGAFQAMTFVIDIAPGAGFPLHSHPGRSEVMLLEGDLTENRPGGAEKVYHPGDSFIEEPNTVHQVTNAGTGKVRLVWTLLLPDGTEPIILH
jgi:quercetin dioxygenase-like cupin family protein